MLKDEIKKGIACDSIGSTHSIVSKTICLSVHPGKMILFPLLHWFKKRYAGRYRFARLLFFFDIFLLGAIATLASIALWFFFLRPESFADKIRFEASVAPQEVASGGLSTLILRYNNETGVDLRDVMVRLDFPEHFLLQEITADTVSTHEREIALGTIVDAAEGSVKIHGVMFGDVGGEQRFRSEMTFVRADTEELAEKIDTYTFSPSRSALVLTVNIFDEIIAYQEMQGELRYKNSGEVTFPEMTITPQWPDGFTLLQTTPPMIRDAIRVPAIKPGDEGIITFRGVLNADSETATFLFDPAFRFDSTSYRQESLTHSSPVQTPPLHLTQTTSSGPLQPGTLATFVIHYELFGEKSIHNLSFWIEGQSPFFKEPIFRGNISQENNVRTIEPGMTGEVVVTVPVRSAPIIEKNSDTFENFSAVTRALATYTLEGFEKSITSRSVPLSTPITTPVVFESFGRYATETGDQIGRGPLPPIVGEETKYWIFWHLNGTTNPLEQVRIEGTLPAGVRFTGRQTASQSGGVMFDATQRTVRWNATRVEPTLKPGNKIVGIAFELGITPTASQIGSAPQLIEQIRLTATDAFTGAAIVKAGADVTTDLKGDTMAEGLGIVSP